MSKRIAAAALVACVLVAGCGGPFAGGETESTTTDSTGDSARVIAAPPSNDTTTVRRANSATTTGTASAGTQATTGGDRSGDAADDTAADENVVPAEATADGETPPGTTGTAASDVETTATDGNATTRETVVTYERDVGYELRVSNARGTAQRVTIRIAAVNDSAVAFDDSVRLAPNESREFGIDFPHAGAYEASVEVGGANVTQRWEVAARNPDDALSVHVAPNGEVYVGFVAI